MSEPLEGIGPELPLINRIDLSQSGDEVTLALPAYIDHHEAAGVDNDTNGGMAVGSGEVADSVQALHDEFAGLRTTMHQQVNPDPRPMELPTADKQLLLAAYRERTVESPTPMVEPNKLRKAMHASWYAVRAATSPSNIKETGKKAGYAAKATGQFVKDTGWRGAVVATEFNPLTNEIPRYGGLALVETYSHNPLLGAAALGGGTAIIEGAGALAAARLITSPAARQAIAWVNKKIGKIAPPDAQLSPVGTAGVAMTLGTPALMSAQQRQNPNRSAEQARKQGLLNVAWMTGVFAVEGALISKGVSGVKGLPEEIGAFTLGGAALWAVPHWVIGGLERRGTERLSREAGMVVGATSGGELSNKQVRRSAAVYEAVRNREDEAVKVGLYGDDLRTVLRNPDSVLLEYAVDDKQKTSYSMPLLVPAESLKWYNMPLLKEVYGEDASFYYYAHPHLPEDVESQAVIAAALKEKLNEGAIIFTDSYEGENAVNLMGMAQADGEDNYIVENLGRGDQERRGITFAAPVMYNEAQPIAGLPSIYDVYQEALESGEVPDTTDNGPSIVSTVGEEDAERIWQIYEHPFDGLSKDHPMFAGFDRNDLMEILQDPEVVKVVNRVDGQISTLFFFTTEFDKCPWFNKTYYQNKYPEYYDTGNILISAGIVTDEKMRGLNYAPAVMDLVVRMMGKRGSNAMITFENTEISATYIPAGVNAVVNRGGAGTVDSDTILTPISSSNYKSIRRAN